MTEETAILSFFNSGGKITHTASVASTDVSTLEDTVETVIRERKLNNDVRVVVERIEAGHLADGLLMDHSHDDRPPQMCGDLHDFKRVDIALPPGVIYMPGRFDDFLLIPFTTQMCYGSVRLGYVREDARDADPLASGGEL